MFVDDEDRVRVGRNWHWLSHWNAAVLTKTCTDCPIGLQLTETCTDSPIGMQLF